MRLRQPGYAYALYCSQSDFEQLEPRRRGYLDYDQARSHVLERYPELARLDAETIRVFVWSHWRSGLRFLGMTEPSSLEGVPDSFGETPRPGRAPPIYEEPTFGPRTIALIATIGVASAVLLIVLLTR